MPVYGQFETVRVLSHGAVATIETARRVDGTGGDNYVVKVFRPVAFATDEDAQRQLQLFLEQAEAQRAVASIPGAHWAPVHELGKGADTAFYVTDRFDVHASQLIHGRAKLSESNLFEILSGAAKGLLELQRAAGRPHGNLKLTNVLIRMGRRGGSARAVLSDPLPTSRIDHDRDAAFDRHALGELLYGLVTHRRYPGPAAWPIESDKSWLAIGGHAGQWCDLCNALLAPPDAGEPLSLEELVDRLEGLRPRAAAGAWRWAAGLGGIALLAGVVMWIMSRPGPGDGEITSKTLEVTLIEFCQEAEWLEEVRTRLVDRDEDDNNDESAPGSDSTAVSDFAGLREEIDDLWSPIAKLADAIRSDTFNYGGISQLCENVNPGAEGIAKKFRENDNEGIVTDALKAVNEIKRTLVRWKPEALVQRAGSYREIEWEQAAGILDELVDNAIFPELLVDTKWVEFEAARSTAAGFAKSGLFTRIDDELNGLRERFTAVASDAEIDQAIAEASGRKFIALADDRDLQTVIDNLKRLQTARKKLEGQPAELAKLNKMIPDVGTENRSDAEERTATMKKDLRGLLTSAEGPLDDYIGRLEKWVEKRVALGRDFEVWVVKVEYLITLLEQSIGSRLLGEDFLQEALRRHWEGGLEEFKSRSKGLPSDSKESRTLRSEVKSALEDVELHTQALSIIENRLRTSVDLSGIPWQATFSPVAAFERVVRRYRQEGLKQIADDISKSGRNGEVWDSIGQTLDAWEETDFRAWLAERKELLNDYARIADRLDEAYGLDEGFPNADSPDTIAQLHAQWTGASAQEYKNMQPIVEEVRKRIDRVNRVENVKSDDELQAKIDIVLDGGENDPAFTVAVWKKYRELATSEPETLEEEMNLLRALNGLIVNRLSPDRGNDLATEIATRWLEREKQVVKADKYRLLLEREVQEAFHVDPETVEGDPRLTFNIALEELKQWHERGGKNEDEPQQRTTIEGFVASWEGRNLLQRIADVRKVFIDLRDDKQTGPKPSEIGPAATNEMDGGARTRWVYDERPSDPENGILSYIWEDQDGGQKHRLTFRRVGSSDEGPDTNLSVTYLSIDEVSVGLFRDLIRERADDNIRGELQNAMDSRRSNDLVTWRWNDEDSPTGIAVAKKWKLDAEPDYYGVSVDPPADGHPIQQITPTAAIYVARLINCRLPTVEEWRWAVGSVEVQKILAGSSPEEDWNSAVGASALDEQLPNLRDETWLKQRDHLDEERSNLSAGLLRDSYTLPDSFGSPDTSVEEGQAVDWNDHTLWFRVTSQDAMSQDGGRFRNIIGNVAEFVWRNDSSILFKGKFPSVDDVRSSLFDRRTDLPVQVIGGSALSDWATVAVMEAQQIRRWNRRYSDVGFRLAFTAEPLSKSWEDRLAALMDPTPPFVFFASDTTDPPQGSSDGS